MPKNTIKFYNLIFPIFILFIIPPYLILAIIGNLLIDGLIVYIVLKLNKVEFLSNNFTKTVFKVFLLGYLADIIGAIILIGIYSLFEPTIGYYHIWNNPLSVIVHLIVVGFVGYLIYMFNKYMLNKTIIDEIVIFRLALSLAIITAPWTFLISASLFY